MDFWTVAWIVWLVATLATFGVLEWQGIRRKGTVGSLSWQFWRVLFTDADEILEGRRPKRPRTLIYFLVAAPLVWLVSHFLLGGRLG